MNMKNGKNSEQLSAKVTFSLSTNCTLFLFACIEWYNKITLKVSVHSSLIRSCISLCRNFENIFILIFTGIGSDCRISISLTHYTNKANLVLGQEIRIYRERAELILRPHLPKYFAESCFAWCCLARCIVQRVL